MWKSSMHQLHQVTIYTLLNTPHDWSGTMKQLRRLYAQTFFTFRTPLVLGYDVGRNLQFQLPAEVDVWRVVSGFIHWVLHTTADRPHDLSPAGLLEPWLLYVGRGCTRLFTRFGGSHLPVWEGLEPTESVQSTGKNWQLISLNTYSSTVDHKLVAPFYI